MMPIITPCLLSAIIPCNPTSKLTVIFSPTAKTLVQIKRSFAVPQLHIRQPFRYNIQDCSVQSYGSSDQSNHYPSLRRLVGFPYLVSPASASSSFKEPRCFFPSDLQSYLLFCRVLDPIWGGRLIDCRNQHSLGITYCCKILGTNQYPYSRQVR